jgi:hypothetical protein
MLYIQDFIVINTRFCSSISEILLWKALLAKFLWISWLNPTIHGSLTVFFQDFFVILNFSLSVKWWVLLSRLILFIVPLNFIAYAFLLFQTLQVWFHFCFLGWFAEFIGIMNPILIVDLNFSFRRFFFIPFSFFKLSLFPF